MRNLGVNGQARFFTALLVLMLIGMPLLLGGCTQPISNAPPTAAGLVGTLFHDQVAQGLSDASWNLHQAQSIGVLPADDPAPKCIDDTLAQINPPGGQSFTPKVNELIGAASVAYIRIRQAELAASQPGAVVDFNCKALIGQIIVDAAALPAKAPALLLP